MEKARMGLETAVCLIAGFIICLALFIPIIIAVPLWTKIDPSMPIYEKVEYIALASQALALLISALGMMLARQCIMRLRARDDTESAD